MEAATPPPAPAPATDAAPGNPTILLVAIALLIIGSIGPWVTFGDLSEGGLDSDGIITLVIALIAGISILVARARGRATSRILLGLCAVIAVAITIIDVLDVQGTDLGGGVSASVGWGLWVALAGSLVLAAAMVGRLLNR